MIRCFYHKAETVSFFVNILEPFVLCVLLQVWPRVPRKLPGGTVAVLPLSSSTLCSCLFLHQAATHYVSKQISAYLAAFSGTIAE
jgi:hypothetical protein